MGNLNNAIAQAMAAESAWEHELAACFGRDACNARYQPRGKGEPGTLLAALHGFYADASAAMHDAFAAARSES
jgi:hypothetical protein